MPVNKFEFALGLLWSVPTIYFLFSLFPPLLRVHQRWEARFKDFGLKVSRPPSWLQRFVFVLLTGLMTAHLLIDAFHHDFTRTSGIGPTTVTGLMIGLPAVFFLLPFIEKHLRR